MLELHVFLGRAVECSMAFVSYTALVLVIVFGVMDTMSPTRADKRPCSYLLKKPLAKFWRPIQVSFGV